MCAVRCGVLFICIRAFQSLYSDKRTAPHFLCTHIAASELLRHKKLKLMKNEMYIAPEAEVLEIAVEQGFATSPGDGGSEGTGTEDW